MESVDFMDNYLDPPAIPEYAECAECHEKYHADDLNDDDLCEECVRYQEACKQEAE